MASELSSKTLDDISNKIADDIAYAFYQQCIQEKLTVKQSEDLMFLLCSFPESKHHDLHTLGECLLDSFFRQFVYHFCMNPSKEAVQKARQSTVDLMRERFRMSFANITPAMMDYMEGVLDPELFPHNLPVLFAGVSLCLCFFFFFLNSKTACGGRRGSLSGVCSRSLSEKFWDG